jgi:EAL domain-containing protein (putative c-di-GMP-specific phosphodiesterase class I)
VRDITTDADDAAIAKAIIALAHSMKLKVIAEGVETVEQLDFLRQQECDQMQGYYLSRPLPADQIEKLLTR